MKELNTDTSRIMKFNNYDEAAAVSIYSTKNKRKKMEDRHICYQDLNNLFNMKVNFLFLLYLLLGRPTANWCTVEGTASPNDINHCAFSSCFDMKFTGSLVASLDP